MVTFKIAAEEGSRQIGLTIVNKTIVGGRKNDLQKMLMEERRQRQIL